MRDDDPKHLHAVADAVVAAHRGDTDPSATPKKKNGQAQYRFRLKSAAEVCVAKPMTWSVRDLIPSRGLFVLFGAPGSGKSFAALDFGISTSRGQPWLKRRTRRARVIYVVLEGHIGERLAAYKSRHDLSDDDLQNIAFVNDAPFDLRNSADVDQLILDVKLQLAGHAGDVVIMIDTLSRALPGANENSSEHMSAAIDACARIEQELQALVGLIHHSGKDVARGSRGWSGLLGACDAEMLCERPEENSAQRTLTFTKVKDGTDGLTFACALEVADIGPRSEVDPDAGLDERRTSCVAIWSGEPPTVKKPVPAAKAIGKNQRLLLDALRANGPWTRKQAYDFMGAAGMPKRRWFEVIESLLLHSVIEDTVLGMRVKS